MTKIQEDILDVCHLKAAAAAAVVVTLASAVAWDEAAGGPGDASVGAVEGVGVVGAVEDDVGVAEGALAVDRACNIAAYNIIQPTRGPLIPNMSIMAHCQHSATYKAGQGLGPFK
ncbi:hypothetical protein C8J57DRAFT_1255435 [Mycena rebaudengoi]|nr:hypothetical protein C8J57DRAFT_1255435 [Mycena rebaudengoi]